MSYLVNLEILSVLSVLVVESHSYSQVCSQELGLVLNSLPFGFESGQFGVESQLNKQFLYLTLVWC